MGGPAETTDSPAMVHQAMLGASLVEEEEEDIAHHLAVGKVPLEATEDVVGGGGKAIPTAHALILDREALGLLARRDDEGSGVHPREACLEPRPQEDEREEEDEAGEIEEEVDAALQEVEGDEARAIAHLTGVAILVARVGAGAETGVVVVEVGAEQTAPYCNRWIGRERSRVETDCGTMSGDV
jgi:hypothetical protein